MKIIGLTGGSGTGKGTVAGLLCELGAASVDADAVYRRLCESDTAMLDALTAAFGDILLPNGALDRPALARIVFADPDQLALLNDITTPYIRSASIQALESFFDHPIVLYDAPTLFETGAEVLCARVIGVIAGRETRVERIMARDGLSETAARARIDAQPDDAYYRARCDYLIDNSGDLENLRRQTKQLYDTLLKENAI